MPNVYKTFNNLSIDNKGIKDVSEAQKQSVLDTLDAFLGYFKAKHI